MRILVVDAMPVVYANFSKVGHLKTTTGIPTGLRYGFLRTVRSYKERTNCDKVVIAWDTHHPVLKAEGTVDYKFGRSEAVEQGTDGLVDKKVMFQQIDGLKHMLSLTAWTQIEAPGYEADDIIGNTSQRLQAQGHETVISTTDNDLCQAVTESVKIFVPKTGNVKKDFYKDEAWVKEYFGVTPKHVPLIRALTGDSSDFIKGLKTKTTHVFDLHAVTNTLLAKPEISSPVELVNEINKRSHPDGKELAALLPEYERIWNLMRLHKPEGATVTKGTSNQDAMTELFTELQFASMFKFVPELCAR